MTQTPARFCNLVLGWCLKRIETKDREQWLYQLELPLPWQSKAKPSTEDLVADRDAFLAFAQSQGG